MPPKKIPKQYAPKSLTPEDRKKQIKSIKEGKERPKVESFKSKPSTYVEQDKKKTGLPVNFDKLADKLTRTDKRKKEVRKGLEEIYDKGRSAYFSSGSRPNQTPESWGKARAASVLVGGPSRKIDKKIVEKYNIPLI